MSIKLFPTTPLSNNNISPSNSINNSNNNSQIERKSQQHKIEILKLLRHIENRLCGDCDTILNTKNIIYSTISFGLWLCQDCANIHLKLLANISKIKSINENWNENEINQMIQSKSNVYINSTSLERYIPFGWNKCNINSNSSERELWILAKYDSHLFSIPNNPPNIYTTNSEEDLLLEENNNQTSNIHSKLSKKHSSTSSIDQMMKLPVRLLDFFVTLSIGQCFETKLNELLTLDKIHFTSEVKSCYPGQYYYNDNTTLPDQLGTFIFPSGIFLSTEEIQPQFFTFVLTDVNAVKMYGGVLHIYELIDGDEIQNLILDNPHYKKQQQQQQQQQQFVDMSQSNKEETDIRIPFFQHGYRPKALVLLSHYPFYNLFRILLFQLYRISLSSCPLPFDRYLSNIFEIPLPPHGVIEVLYTSLPECPLLLYRPPRNQLPMIDYSFRPLFMSLSVDNILLIFSFILHEHKVCFCSKNISILTPIQEAFLSFIFPFVWQGAYIPILPSSMMIILDAPVPFIIGVNSDYIPLFGTSEYSIPDDLIMVDIDNDKVLIGNDISGKKIEIFELPPRELTKLKETLIKSGSCIYGNRKIQSYLNDFCQPFPNNEHMIPLNLETGNLFQSTNKLNIYNTIVKSAETKVQINYQCTLSLLCESQSNNNNNNNNNTNLNDTTNKNNIFSNKRQNIMSNNYLINSILSPSNNCIQNSSNSNSNSTNSFNPTQPIDDNFDVKEIRYAFLRFFISILRDFQQYFEENLNTNNSKLNKLNFLNSHPNTFLGQL